ncbi:sigma-70 family RNA polymerase sigma factor [Dyadobacter sp. 32]|uniref:RNA polymerase sigma factor n=1 Tax=Dyadobacter sp. 32 TaxID=538966 RepID=UPI0011EC0411
MKTLNSDMLLWNTFQKGDKEAFARIYNLYVEDLLSYGYRVTSNRQLIKDSIQDLFLHLWLHRENLSETDSVKFYLFRSLRNRIIRNMEKGPVSSDNSYPDRLENVVGDLPFEHDLMQRETDDAQILRLKHAIEKLSKRQQEVILFRYHHDFSLEQIAQLMHLNNQSVRNLLHRAISQLRGTFEVAGWIFLVVLGLA